MPFLLDKTCRKYFIEWG